MFPHTQVASQSIYGEDIINCVQVDGVLDVKLKWGHTKPKSSLTSIWESYATTDNSVPCSASDHYYPIPI